MQQRSNDLLGADLRIESTVPIDTFWQESAENIGLRSTVTTHFPTMVLAGDEMRSEEHTSELQSRPHLVCRLLLEKKKNSITNNALALSHSYDLATVSRRSG